MNQQTKKMIRAFVVLVLLGVSGDAFSSVTSSSAVAYLFDSAGVVFVIRAGVTNRVESSCVTLFEQDRIALFEDASARVIFPSSLYELAESRLYLIQRGERVAEEADSGETIAVLSMRGFRGAGNPLLRGGDEPDLVLPPTELFAYVKPPVFRQSKNAENVDLLSPVGVVRSTTPLIEWECSLNGVCDVSLAVVGEDETSASRFPVVRTETNRLLWADTGWPLLERGEMYRLSIRREGELVTGQNSCFVVLDQDVADEIEGLLAVLPPSGDSSRLFTEASLLLDPDLDCAAEARVLASQLVLAEPENPVFLRLLKRCYVRLGLGKQAEGVDAKILQYEGARP